VTDDSPGDKTFETTLLIKPLREDSVLVVREGRDWALPRVKTRGHWHAEISPVISAAETALNLTINAVRCLRLDRAADVTHSLWLMEGYNQDWKNGSLERWIDIDELTRIAPAEAQELSQALLDDTVLENAPWLYPGFAGEMTQWVLEQPRLGRLRGAPVQVRHWSIASIWQFPAEYADLWFKAVLPMFAYEGTLIQLIAPSMPQHLPRVIAVDRARGWTLMEALPANPQDDVPQWQRDTSGPEWEQAVRVLARLQQSWIGREDELFAAGCPDRRLATLPAALDELLASDMVRGGLSADEQSRLAAFAKEVPDRVDALRDCGLPEALMHGDFHAGNVVINGNTIVIFDWTDGCVSHPFFDMATFLPRDPVDRAALLHAYLEAWRPLATDEQIERAWELAQPLACVHHALSYKRILQAVHPGLRWEFDQDVTFWLRWLRDLLA
jgi:hypothetical protein